MRRLIGSSVAAGSLLLMSGAGCSGNKAEPKGDDGSDPIAQTASALVDSNYSLDANPDLPNPERGVSYWVGNTASDPHTIKNHFLWLGNHCNATLVWQGRSNANTTQVLKDWANTAISLRDAGQKVIFRPRYDTPGDATEGAPNSCGKVEGQAYSLMQSHAQAIANMLGDPEIRPIVAFVEMGYLGSWGEWNTRPADCGTDVNVCRQLAPVLLAASQVNDRIHFAKDVITKYRAAGMTRTVALRRPEFYKDAEANAPPALATTMGFYNDCFMANAGDMGTFSRLRWDYSNYTELYPNSVLPDEASAKSYMQSKADNGSQGGESCPDGNNETWRTSPSSVPTRLDADSFHYLHGGYAEDFRQTMINAGQWNTIKSRLGYRYQVTQVNYPTTATAGASVTVSVTINNGGFAKIPYDRTAYLVLLGPTNYVVGNLNPKTGTYTLITPTVQSNVTARTWSKAAPITFSQTFPAPSVPGTYTLHLYVPDTDCVNNASCSDTIKAQYAVRLATLRGGANVFNTSTGTNNLGVTLAVSSGSGGTGTHACSSTTDCQTHLTKSGLPAWNGAWGDLNWASGTCSMYDWTETTAYYGAFPGQCSTNQPPGSTCVCNNDFAEKEYSWSQCKD